MAEGHGFVESGRDRILSSVRLALLSEAEFPSSAQAGVAVPGAPGTPLAPPEGEQMGDLDLLEEVLRDYKAHVTRASHDEIPNVLAQLISDQPLIKSVVVPKGLDPSWYEKITGSEIILDLDSIPHSELAAVDAVITGCTTAVAETGTLVLSSRADEGRRAISLLPDFHFCVVRSEAIVRSVAEIFQRADASRPVTLISGPSATSDIELRRVEGVHGPRNLFVILVQ